MKKHFQRLGSERSGAVAMIFALALIPLILLVALSVDYAFYVQARAQAALTADAAATHAVRAADATYTYELVNDPANAVADAKAAGQSIGMNWFNASLGTMPKSVITGGPNVTVMQNANGSAGFTATVDFQGVYPPFFASLFNSPPWHINGGSQAVSAYQYVEILMLLDNSSSMLIASTPAEITQLEELTVCPSSKIDPSFDGNGWGAYYQNVAPDSNGLYPADLIPETGIANYTPVANATNLGSNEAGTGNPTSGLPSRYGYAAGKCGTGWQGTGNSPYAPCAFACHTNNNPLQVPTVTTTEHQKYWWGGGTTTTTTVSYTANAAYTNDYYGIARQAGIHLRLDVVQSAASQVVTAMQSNEEASGQFSVGIYEFNDDVNPVWPKVSGGQQPAEASTDLAGAATEIQNAPVPLQANASIGNTNFVSSINDMISGKYLNGITYRADAAGTNSPALTASGNGTTAATPVKDVFIVTDGMEDTSVPNGRIEGEMTGYMAENGAPTAITPALCGKLKNLGDKVYVLYIDYSPLGNQFYQITDMKASNYGKQDYPSLSAAPTKLYAQSTSSSVSNPPNNAAALSTVTPDEAGLIGCASSPSDFFEATSDSEIATAMNAMLHAALTSSIQLTQ